MSEPVERVAKGIFEDQRSRLKNQDGLAAKISWRDKAVTGFDPFWQSYEYDARSAISAMREPTEEILQVGIRASSGGVLCSWQAMIDEMLK